MTTVATRTRRIAELEGFDLIAKQGRKVLSPSANGVLGPYPREKAALNRWTVQEWKEKRFEAAYEGYTCDVLLENGTVASPTITLEEVRASYFEE